MKELLQKIEIMPQMFIIQKVEIIHFIYFLRTASADHYGQRGFFNHKKFRDGKAET